MCLSVCYLFVSLVSSAATWWLSGSFCLVCLPTSSLLSQWFFVVWSVRCGSCVLCLRHFKIFCFWWHLLVWCVLLFVILNSLHIKVVRNVLLVHVFVFELSEGIWIAILTLFVFFWTVLFHHWIACLLFESVPLLLKLLFEFGLFNWIQCIQRMLGWHPYFVGASIWHAIAYRSYISLYEVLY